MNNMLFNMEYYWSKKSVKFRFGFNKKLGLIKHVEIALL